MDLMDGLRSALAADDAYYKERGIFQARFGFGKRPALIVIDMAYGWTDPEYAGGSARLDSAIAAIEELLPVCRTRKVPIVYTTSVYHEEPHLKSAADFSPRFRKWDQRACTIDERVSPLPSEYVIAKEHSSAFAGTPLTGWLIGHQVDTLIITGCSTSACVRSTAVDAKSFQFKPIVVREGVQDRAAFSHEFTLFDIQARFADVVGVAETIGYLERSANGPA